MLTKPDYVFDRDAEWRALASFLANAGNKTQLGIVSGRRRQGKTYLLESLVRQTGGFYFGAQQATQAESLRQFADAVAAWAGLPGPPRLGDWNEAFSYLFALERAHNVPLVIDEFPYLVKDSPGLPSVLQHAIDRGVFAGSGPSLLLSGSAMSVMGRMLAGNAPLRGRANLELVIKPFDYRLAADYWSIEDPQLAVLVDAVVGGTPAYLRFINEDSPSGLDDFDNWVVRNLLSVSSPLFREARYLLDEEADVRDSALYHSVLAAVANGNNTRGGIAGYIGRKGADIGHHLNVLEDCALLRREPDVLRSGRSVYRIAEPLLTFYQVAMRPDWVRLESGRVAQQVWRSAQARFFSQVVGPHYEQICREWTLFLSEGVVAPVSEVGAAQLTDPARKEQIEIDVVALGPNDHGNKRKVVAVGEAKWGERMGAAHIAKLQRALELLAGRGYDTTEAKLLCFTSKGIHPDVAEVGQVQVVTVADLYR